MRKITIKEKDYLALVNKESQFNALYEDFKNLRNEYDEVMTSDKIFPNLGTSLALYIGADKIQHQLQAGSHMFPVITTKTVVIKDERKTAAVVILPENFFQNPVFESFADQLVAENAKQWVFENAANIFQQNFETKEGLPPTSDTQGADDPDDIKNLFHPAQ